MKITLKNAVLTAGLAALFSGQVGAVTISGGLTNNVLNTIEDQDREAYVDVNASGTLDVGDVFVGFVRIDNFLPAGLSSNNQVYGVLSNQVISVDGADPTLFSLGTTTAAGLRLQDLTGNANTAGGMFAIYDQAVPYGTDLINNSAPGATTLKDDIDFILATGTLQLVAGIVSADNYLTVDNTSFFPAGVSNTGFPTLDASIQTGSFTAGLDFLYNNTGFVFADAVNTVNPLTGLVTTPLGIANGAVRGADGDGNEAVLTDASAYTAANQCDDGSNGSIACGFVTDADFFVRPVSVPEPTSLLLIGSGLLGLVGARRRRTIKS